LRSYDEATHGISWLHKEFLSETTDPLAHDVQGDFVSAWHPFISAWHPFSSQPIFTNKELIPDNE
jgi:hypothetical protein